MGLFNRFKKKTPSVSDKAFSQQAESDTACILIMDRVMEDASQAANIVKQAFGSDVVGEVDQSHAPAPLTHMIVTLEGTEFWCSYMPFPVPPEEMNLPDTPQYSMFNLEEYQAICNSKSFWLIVQKGDGQSLAGKRQVCRLLTSLVGALLETEGSLGVYVSAAELLISRRVYLQNADILKKNAEDPKSHWAEIHEKLYLMSIFQITEKEFYKDGDTIAFTEGNITTFKEMNGALFLIGGNV